MIKIIKYSLAGLFYLAGLAFALYVSNMVLAGHIIFNFTGLAICALGVCIPIATAGLLMTTCYPDNSKRIRVMKVSMLIIFAYYIILLFSLLFHNGFRSFIAASGVSLSDSLKWNTNIIPFKTIGRYISSYMNNTINKSIVVENLIGNIFVFAPMGVLLPCIFANLRSFSRYAVVMLMILVGVEVGQLLTHSGSCDIDDVILNFIGSVAFFGLWKLESVQRILKRIYVV